MKKSPCVLLVYFLLMSSAVFAQHYSFNKESRTIIIEAGGKQYVYSALFSVIYSKKNPSLAMRPSGIKGIRYNVPAWLADSSRNADLRKTTSDARTAGDGWDENIIGGDTKGRTTNMLNAGRVTVMEPIQAIVRGDSMELVYKEQELFTFKAVARLEKNTFPSLSFECRPKAEGYFSVGYTGAPSFTPDDLREIWQPMIWQEKRFPDRTYVTPAHLASLPACLVNDGVNTTGVLVAPECFPFDPLPVLANSGFGLSLKNNAGKAQSQVFAPLMGGAGSKLGTTDLLRFKFYLVAEPAPVNLSFESLARKYYGFRDYRHNEIASLNEALDNIIDYSLTPYAWFVDSLKGFSYATDAPGTVKNVSSLHPLGLSLITGNAQLFNRRAYPLIEFMLSRERTLFSLDSNQKIQSPSRKLRGTAVTLSELVSLYRSSDQSNQVYRKLAEERFKKTDPDNWLQWMEMYKLTGENPFIEQAKKGADKYLEQRVNTMQSGFDDKYAGGFYFTFTNRWTNLLELYELTGEQKYLDAAWSGARYYAMFAWMGPKIPDTLITVNKDGKAPMYNYVKNMGHRQMYYPEEKVPAWRLSEIGLLPESSGTSASHRGVFMTNHAPWMLRLGYYKKDSFLIELAKAAVAGRYRSFPGYHINTARTTAYEKLDFPLHRHKDQSVNSFHYNHIMPMASMLLDYLVTDAYTRSKGKINFPGEYMEGYGYLQNRFYGAAKGSIYNEKGLQLWMPSRLLKPGSVELNYITARKGDTLFIALMNQSASTVKTQVKVNDSLAVFTSSSSVAQYRNSNWSKMEKITGQTFPVQVAANGLTVIRLTGIDMQTSFQDALLATLDPLENDYEKTETGNARAMLFRFGTYATKAFIYLQDDDTKYNEVILEYQLKDGVKKVLRDNQYPFEFTIDVPVANPGISFRLTVIGKDGAPVTGKVTNLGSVSSGMVLK